MQISIIACGWLGLPLGEYLNFIGYKVKGSATNLEKAIRLKNAYILPFVLKLNPVLECDNFSKMIDSEIIIINIPPKVAQFGTEYHLQQIKNLTKHILLNFKNKTLPKIIYVSSTSVYEVSDKIVTEQSATNSDSVLIKAENYIKANFDFVTILRLGGLMGYDRYPSKYFKGKTVENWNIGVNYIHRDDAILIISEIISQNIWGQTFNICSPMHPIRKEILVKNCSHLLTEKPIFSEISSNEKFKIISPEKFISLTNYQFKYDNPMDYFYEN